MMAKIKITQTGSPIRRDKTQRATLVGLGLNKLHRTVEVEGTPEVLGQVRKVAASAERRGGGLANIPALPQGCGERDWRDKSESECTT